MAEALELFAAFYPDPVDPREVLASLGLQHIADVAFRNLSGGQQQRVSIALALVGNPKIAVLDELTTGLDPEARRATWAIIEGLRGRGVTVILVTHFMDEAEVLCDRLALIDRGRLRALDTPEALVGRAAGNRVRFAPAAPVTDAVLYAIPGVATVQRKDRYLTVTGTGDLAASLVNALAALGVGVSELETRRGNLDDAFIQLTRQADAPAASDPADR